jgi:hypothetical protein
MKFLINYIRAKRGMLFGNGGAFISKKYNEVTAKKRHKKLLDEFK